MSDSIVNCSILKTPTGALNHYEVTFVFDVSPLPVTVTVLPSEMSDSSDLEELKTLACAKAVPQKTILSLVSTEENSLNGPVTL